MLPPWLVLDPLLLAWLREDWGRGDLTTLGLFGGETPLARAQVLLKEPGVICGLSVLARVFTLTTADIQFTPLVAEGTYCADRTAIARLQGPAPALLMAERVALNLTQRLSGIATLTRTYVEALQGTTARLTDTRKTTPGLRILEKYATRIGGATNHRLGLDDAVLLKDNHIQAAGSIHLALQRIRPRLPHLIAVEVECETLAQVEEALACGVDMILLDNMQVDQLRAAVQFVAGRVPLEASGNVTLANIAAVAQTGVDFIATSAPITRARWLDISLDFLS
ncbi:carboxylating nicotinate-nucleotide diphosphorylase [Candidatus Cyanaurora vandensis]|uniref:carboxylating nicotinate-nucleotide diphosphorylase n=1 Tax=Candidatus Cyanaurora vandensis TaxID=2714958 RepID=UPI00257B37F0|nr:carboxylating nicotinate-nucleotide diphosphorylase [Candidatus Cyanaurora vandensis]